MSIKQRLEKLEAVAKIQTAKHAVTEIWLVPLIREPDEAITSTARWRYPSSKFVAVSGEEIKNPG